MSTDSQELRKAFSRSDTVDSMPWLCLMLSLLLALS
jgi:hypothetical protein